MLLTSFYAILGTFYTLLHNTDLDLSYFDLSYVFPGHNDSVEQGLTVLHSVDLFECYCSQVSNTDLYLSYFDLSYVFPGHNDSVE